MKIHESAENYLETIFILAAKNGQVRSIDLARHMNFSKPTISIAMRQFREEGYVTVDENGLITLTEKGLEIAESMYDRHQLLSNALRSIGVSDETADADACKIEHDISAETFECLKAYIQSITKKKTEKQELSVELL